MPMELAGIKEEAIKKLLYILFALLLASPSWAAYTETFYLCNGGNGSAPEVNACAGAFDEGDINTSGNWDTDDSNDGKIGPNDLVEIMDNGGAFDTQIVIQQPGLTNYPITFKKQTGDTPTFSGITTSNGDFNINGKAHITIDGIIFDGGTNKHIYAPSGSHYLEVANCTFQGLGGPSDDNVAVTASNYIYIHDNIFLAGAQECYEGDSLILANCDYGRVIDNDFLNGNGHQFIVIGYGSMWNVVRGNTGLITDAVQEGDGCPPYYNGEESNTIDAGFGTLKGSTFTLFEDNLLNDNAGEVSGDRTQGLKNNKSAYTIWRRNTVNGMDSFGWGCYVNPWDGVDINYEMVYNNTFYDTSNSSRSQIYEGAVDVDAGETDQYKTFNNFFVNNIMHTMGHYGITIGGQSAYFDVDYVYDNVFRNNMLYNSTLAEVKRYFETNTIANMETSYPTEFIDNLTTEPTFTSAATGDFSADDGLAPQVDAGAWLTTITSATGSGTSFSVANPYFFYDGWGIPGETGDVIKTENGQTATITSVNNGTGQITVASPGLSWIKDEGLALDYSGTKPDIGAEEFGGDSPVTLSDFYPANAVSNVPITADLTWTNGVGVTDVDVYFDDNDCSTKVIDGLDVETYVIPGDMAYEDVFTWKVVANPDTDNISYPPTGCYTFETTSGPPITPDSLGSTIFNTNAGDRKYNVNAGDTKF